MSVASFFCISFSTHRHFGEADGGFEQWEGEGEQGIVGVEGGVDVVGDAVEGRVNPFEVVVALKDCGAQCAFEHHRLPLLSEGLGSGNVHYVISIGQTVGCRRLITLYDRQGVLSSQAGIHGVVGAVEIGPVALDWVVARLKPFFKSGRSVGCGQGV